MTHETIDTQVALERAFDAVQEKYQELCWSWLQRDEAIAMEDALSTLRQAIEARGKA